MSVQQQHLSMSLLSKQLQQHEQHWEPHCAWPGQQQQCSLHHQEHTQQFEGADLSEQAEEQLVNVPPMAAASGAAMAAATTNLTDDRLEQTASSGSSHCVLALPSIDAANVGLWWLSQPTAPSPASGMNSCRDNPNMQPHIILQQHKTQDRATHGLCMAVGLCQPQVGTRQPCAGLFMRCCCCADFILFAVADSATSMSWDVIIAARSVPDMVVPSSALQAYRRQCSCCNPFVWPK
jgi:hypothetical protein